MLGVRKKTIRKDDTKNREPRIWDLYRDWLHRRERCDGWRFGMLTWPMLSV